MNPVLLVNMMNRIKKSLLVACVAALTSSACQPYLDVVPDNVATIDNAFTMRTQAQKFLFTCYSYMPKDGDLSDNPAIAGGDELWSIATRGAFARLPRSEQKVVSPYGDRWVQFYRALRDCNIFLENVGKVPDLEPYERDRWISEVKFLKAYYHFCLVRMYGPVPLLKENLPVDATLDQVKVVRDPVDSCFQYIASLLDEAVEWLPLTIDNPAQEAGRITKPICLAFKAKVLVTAASPLFNGNTEMGSLKNPDGTALFNTTFSKEKWTAAANAAKEAIELCHQQGYKLYEFLPAFQQYNLTDTTLTQMSIRNSVAEAWNTEIIWANTQTNSTALQQLMTTWIDPKFVDGVTTRGELSPPLKMVELFYSEHGVPIQEDKTWDYANRYDLRVGEEKEKLYIREGYTTAQLNFDREPRFYASLGFDGGMWYGQGVYDDQQYTSLFSLEAKFKQRNGVGKENFGTVTGYFVKKLIHYQNVIGTGSNYSVITYPWPLMRLADLYLLYAEALNESSGPVPEVYEYLDRVRHRAGLPSVAESWENYAKNPGTYKTEEGLREIIRQERMIELAFEANRFWDIRRWMTAMEEMNDPIMGWDLYQSVPFAYYRPTVVYRPMFGTKDYLWPIDERNLTANNRLVQNPGW